MPPRTRDPGRVSGVLHGHAQGNAPPRPIWLPVG